MTLTLIDIASWQTAEKRARDPLNLSVAKKAGVDLVNIKIGQGDWYGFRSWMRDYANEARRLGLGVSTFHWLDNTASGAAQAKIAYARMKELGGPDNMAHQCDCEDSNKPATFAIWRDYVNAMQDYLGRKIVNYTGDWWWKPKGWTGAGVTPYLWAAPNAGYPGYYPGDASASWKAGYGGWDNYSVLQYAVSPIEGAGGGNLSKSAIRDPKVWAALTGANREDPNEMAMDKATFIQWFQEALGDPEVDKILKAKGWQYIGGGIPAGMSTLNVLNEDLVNGRALLADVAEMKAALADIEARQLQLPEVKVDPVAVAKALITELGRPAA